MTDVNYAATWSEFVNQLTFADLPADVVHRMKRSLLDMLGVCITGSRYRSCAILHAFIRSQASAPQATVIPNGTRTSSIYAALVNGTYVHSTELAESFTRAVMHAGNAVPPAALAEAERKGASGRDLITAMAAGYEIAIRSGMATRLYPNSATFAAKPEDRPEYPNLGFSHPVATWGIYGSVAAAAKLMKLDAARTKHAFTISSSLTPAIGISSGFLDGAMAKDMWQGVTNAQGVMAAELAAFGFTGPNDVTNHFAALVKDYEASWLTRDLGSVYYISSGGLHFKIHQTAGMTQSAADAVLDALSKRPVKPQEVERVDVLVNRRGTRALMLDADPPNDVAAKVSIPYVVSAVLAFQDEVKRDPHFTELYAENKFHDQGRRSLAQKVAITGSDEFERGFDTEWPMRFPANVEIRLKSGDTVSGRSEIWSVTSQLSDEKVIAKFKDLAGRVMPSDHVDRAVEKVFNVDKLESIEELVRSVCL